MAVSPPSSWVGPVDTTGCGRRGWCCRTRTLRSPGIRDETGLRVEGDGLVTRALQRPIHLLPFGGGGRDVIAREVTDIAQSIRTAFPGDGLRCSQPDRLPGLLK